MKMKNLLAVLLIAILLLSPGALMEEENAPQTSNEMEATEIGEPVIEEGADGISDSGTETAVSDGNTTEPYQDVPVTAEAFEAAVSVAEDVDLYEAEGGDSGAIDEVQNDGPIEVALMLEASVEEVFTDPGFRAWVLSKYDTNGNKTLDDSEWKAIREETSVDLSTASNKDQIIDLEGIGYFNSLQTLDVSACTNLTKLQYCDSGLKTLNIKGCTSLTRLFCSWNKLTNLNFDDCTKLQELDCSGIKMSSLDVSKLTSLKDLQCDQCNLTSLDLRNNRQLTRLVCRENSLSALNIDNNPNLNKLYIRGNPQLKTLDISHCPKLVEIVTKWTKKADPGFGENSIIYESDERIIGLLCDQSLSIITGETPDPAPEGTSDTTLAPAVVAPVSTVPVVIQEPITITKVPASVKAKVKKNKVTVSWKKIKKTKKTKALLGQIKSIQVQYSTDPNFVTDVNTKNVGKKKTKVTVKGLQKKTVYYVRVRYVGSDGVSNWGAVKRVKTK